MINKSKIKDILIIFALCLPVITLVGMIINDEMRANKDFLSISSTMEEMASVYARNHSVDFDGKNVEDVYPQLVAKNLVKNTNRPDVIKKLYQLNGQPRKFAKTSNGNYIVVPAYSY